MKLSHHEYIKILSTIEHAEDCNECLAVLTKRFPRVSLLTLGSIISQQSTKRTMVNLKKVRENLIDIVIQYNEAERENKTGIFVLLGRKYGVSPVSLARIVIEHFMKSRVGSVSHLIRDSSLIDDANLSYELHTATLHDSNYSQVANIIKMLKGREYEEYLQSLLSAEGISYKTENDLRNLNFPKTPDILLDVPIAVDNQIIKWIECKALFADEETHYKYIRSQYMHYYNFGPGLVIYWDGFIDTIKNEPNKLLVYDEFPKNIIQIK